LANAIRRPCIFNWLLIAHTTVCKHVYLLTFTIPTAVAYTLGLYTSNVAAVNIVYRITSHHCHTCMDSIAIFDLA